MMVGLAVKQDCLERVEQAMKCRGLLTNGDLGNEVNVTPATIGKFRKGVKISKKVFEECCHYLDLDWREIGDFEISTQDPGTQKEPVSPTQKFLIQYPFPTGALPFQSPFYLCRSPLEERWYEQIQYPSALLRLCGPRKMGKSSLALQILGRSAQLGHQALNLSFGTLRPEDMSNTTQFLGWFYTTIAMELKLIEEIKRYKDFLDLGFVGSSSACLNCFSSYLLPRMSMPLTLCIDKIDRLLANPEVARDFFALLRVMHEKTKIDPIWQNFRLILVYSSEGIESLVELDINQSPFNVGTVIQLSEFTSEQGLQLAQRYGLNWSMAEAERLIQSSGGIPKVVQMQLYAIASGETTLEQLVLPSTPVFSNLSQT
jgi:AAA-like domain